MIIKMIKFFTDIIKGLKLLTKKNNIRFFIKVKLVFHRFFDKNAYYKFILSKLILEKNALYFLIDGFKIYFKPHFNIKEKKIYLNSVINAILESFLFPDYFNFKVKLKKGDFAFNVGGFLGLTALIFSRAVGENGKVYTIEPVTYHLIEKNLKENNINNVVLINKAIGNKVGSAEIEISDFCSDSSICKREYTSNYYRKKKKVDLITLGSLVTKLKLKRLDFIQMDIEGAEELAIKGAYSIIDKFRPKWSISSYHIDHKNENQHYKLVNLLKKFNYNIKQISHKHIYAW